MEELPPGSSALPKRFVERRALLLTTAGVLTILSFGGLVRLDFSDSPRDIFSRDDEHSRLLDEVHETFGADDTDILVVLDGDDLLSRESLRLIDGFTRQVRDSGAFEAVYSILDARRAVRVFGGTQHWMIVPPFDREGADFSDVPMRLLEHPLVGDRMLSRDGRTTIVIVQLPDTAVDIADIAEHVAWVQAVADAWFAESPVRVRLTGQPPLRVDTFHNLKTDQLKFSASCGVTLFLIALALFRRLQPVVLAFAGPGAGVLWTVGAMGWAGQRFDGINVVLPMLLFVIGFTDSLHLVTAIRNARRGGASPYEAAVAAVGELGRACFLTSLTTAIGFGSLSLSNLTSIHRFGVYAALGALALYLAVIVIVPLGSMLPWVRNLVADDEPQLASGGWLFGAGVLPILRLPSLISVIGIISVSLLAGVGSGVPFDMHWSEALPASGDTVEAIHHLDDALGGSVLALVVVQWPEGLQPNSREVLQCVSEIHAALDAFSYPIVEGRPRLGKPTSVLTLLEASRPPGAELSSGFSHLARRAPERLSALVNYRERRLLVTVPLPEAGARTLLPIFNEIDAVLDRIMADWPGFDAVLTGSTVVSARNLHDILVELVQSISLAATIVFATLCVAFGSFRLGLISIIPNTFPIVVVVALLVPLDVPMQVTAALTLCLSLGIAVDNTIHVIARFRRERAAGRDAQAACLHAYGRVGKVIVLTTIILVCGLSTMLLSESPAIRLFGGLSCVALLAALVGDLLFLPALLVCLSRKGSQ